MLNRRRSLLFWLPRILGILFILFLSMFALDIFEMNLGFWGTMVGLFMHLIPSFMLVAVLVIAWRWEMAGGILWIVVGLLYLVISPGSFSGALSLVIPVFIVGILFLADWAYTKMSTYRSDAKTEL